MLDNAENPTLTKEHQASHGTLLPKTLLEKNGKFVKRFTISQYYICFIISFHLRTPLHF